MKHIAKIFLEDIENDLENLQNHTKDADIRNLTKSFVQPQGTA